MRGFGWIIDRLCFIHPFGVFCRCPEISYGSKLLFGISCQVLKKLSFDDLVELFDQFIEIVLAIGDRFGRSATARCPFFVVVR
jgi:hypothetical protein